MLKYENGKFIEMTAEEIEMLNRDHEEREKAYWSSISYGDAVNEKIKERYTDSQELSILRQKDEKPEEYAAYYAYCEECKAFVKGKKGIQ